MKKEMNHRPYCKRILITLRRSHVTLSSSLKDFENVKGISLEENLNTDDEGDIAYILEVDFGYSDLLLDKHSDCHLILDKEPLDHITLSKYQSQLENTLNISNNNIKKMRQAYQPKKKKVTQNKNLKLLERIE